MKKYYFYLLISSLFLFSCQASSPFRIGNQYGAKVSYGNGRHPGIDYEIGRGTPIIAASYGEVVYVGDADCPKKIHCGGFFVEIRHGDHFNTFYGHLQQAFVKKGQILKRGELIGISGASNSGYIHLHFSVCTIGGKCDFHETYNPKNFWLDSQAQCYDFKKDYSDYSQKDITLPIACGKYSEILQNQINKLQEQ